MIIVENKTTVNEVEISDECIRVVFLTLKTATDYGVILVSEESQSY